jgi:purine-binding chemotaxis protein CheW
MFGRDGSASAEVFSMSRTSEPGVVLIVGAGASRVAIGLEFVLETMRCRSVRAVAGAPSYLLGVALIRGAAVPVVDLGALLFDAVSNSLTRIVTLRTGARSVALAVDRVIGVAKLDANAAATTVPLLAGAAGDKLAGVGALDRELLFVLDGALTLDEATFRLIDGVGDEAKVVS